VSVVFYYDLGSPYAYLAAERIDEVLPVNVTWRALLLGGLFRATGRGSWGDTREREAGIAEVERRAAERGLPPLVWPEPWPNDGLLAMRAAVAAETLDRGPDFAREAMRLQFRDGAPLSDPDVVSRAAGAAGIAPGVLLQLAVQQPTKDRLRRQTEEALALGVEGVPAVACADGTILWGDDELENAATHLRTISGR
jgi:2-hydroxychromene-2-carboxylate isomerase